MTGFDEALAIAAPVQTVGPLERALALRSLPQFQTMRARQVAALAQLMGEYSARRGTLLQRAGERVRSVYLLRDGRVRRMRDGRPAAAVDAPAVLGLVDWLADERASTSVMAETDVSALTIAGAALRDVLEDNFSLVLHLRAVIGGEIAALERQLGSYRIEAATLPPALPDGAGEPLDMVGRLVRLQGARELRPLGVAVLAALLRDEESLRAAAGDELFAAGAPATRFLLIVHGAVTCSPPAPHAPFRAGAGDMLGRDAALSGLPYAYRAVAETEVLAIPIDARLFWDVAEDDFHVAHSALAICARRLLALTRSTEPQPHP